MTENTESRNGNTSAGGGEPSGNRAAESGALWGGRFASGPSPELQLLSKSTQFDWALAQYDIRGSKAHAAALAAGGYLSDDELRGMREALDELSARVADGRFLPAEDDEDVHSALERGLIEIAGPALGGKLRAGRSRNDQIATLVRLYLLDHAAAIRGLLLDLAEVILDQALAHPDAILPGRTHLQHAQPVLLAHQLAAHAWPLIRDVERLRDWAARARRSPYGGGALAGSSLGLDPRLVAAELGLGDPLENSIDGTAARDVVAEFAFVCAQIGIDLSRLSEEIIIWNTKEFGFVRLHDGYSTGSSIMPQKKNPDIAELARGMSGTMIGNLAGILATLKAMPLAYNRDLAEDKRALFETIDLLDLILPAFAGMVATMTFDTGRMAADAPRGFTLATEVADWLVRQGIPFAHAHEISGATVRYCEERGMELDGLTEADLPKIDAALTADVLRTIDPVRALAERFGQGGTAPARVREQIAAFADTCTRQRAWAARGLEGVALEPSAGVAA